MHDTGAATNSCRSKQSATKTQPGTQLRTHSRGRHTGVHDTGATTNSSSSSKRAACKTQTGTQLRTHGRGRYAAKGRRVKHAALETLVTKRTQHTEKMMYDRRNNSSSSSKHSARKNTNRGTTAHAPPGQVRNERQTVLALMVLRQKTQFLSPGKITTPPSHTPKEQLSNICSLLLLLLILANMSRCWPYHHQQLQQERKHRQ